MRILFHLIGVAAGLMVLSCKPAPDRFDLNEFRHPSATYRSMSFWSLNDSLSADEMRRQLALFKEGGFGGAFFHSRPGLLTPYLSEDWFDLRKTGKTRLWRDDYFCVPFGLMEAPVLVTESF